MNTKHTKLHRTSIPQGEILFRDLSVGEVAFLTNIKSDVRRNEFAAEAAIVKKPDSIDVPWPVLQQIGSSAMNHSLKYVNDKQLFEIAVKESREDVNNGTTPLGLISHIVKAFPGTSLLELLNMTFRDLIELTCLAEAVTESKVFNVAGSPIRKKGTKLVNPAALEDDGKSLQEKMSELNASLGPTPRL